MSVLPSNEPQPLAYDIATAAKISSIGITKLYQLIGAKRLATSKIGKRRVILADSLRQLLAEGC